MKLQFRTTIWIVFAIIACGVALPCVGQEPAAEPKPVEEEPKDSAVAAILATKPATPAECVRAAKILFELGRPDLAKPLLKKVLDAGLDRGQLAELGRGVGQAMFVEMAGREALLPEARKLADAVAAAVRAEAEDAKRIDELIRQLQNPSARKRLEAVVGLQEARDAAVAPLIAVLADRDRAVEWANVRAALVEMGRAAVGPLTAIVGRADPKLAVQAIATLGAMNDRDLAMYLFAPCLSDDSDEDVRRAAAVALRRLTGGVPGRDEAIKLLSDSARAYLDGRQPVEGAKDGKLRVWRWDESKRQCIAENATPAAAARALAARWARDAYSLAPHQPRLRLLHLTAMLEAAAHENGLDRPLDEKHLAVVEAERFGVGPLVEVMQYGMARGHTAAAAAAAHILGRIGTAQELLGGDAAPATAKQGSAAAGESSAPSPLTAALQSPDRRLRLAAAEAIVRLQPIRQFSGSSRVVDVLAFLASSRGVRGALAASPNAEIARDLAGRLAAAGYQSDAFSTGREVLLRAAESPDCELILIDSALDRPTADLLLQQLRHDPRTAWMRVGVIASADRYEQADRVLGDDLLAKAFARPRDDRAFNWQLEQLAALGAEDFVGFAARQRQAARALDLLAELARSSSELYDLRRVDGAAIAALSNPNPAIAARAAGVLAELNSAAGQRALVETASHSPRPLALRQAAAKAFSRNVEKYGLRLTADEIQRQYDVYNRNEKRDAPSQQVLSLILDCIEAAGK